MDKKNPIDPIMPPSSDNESSVFSNQTPQPHPEQGNPEAFTSPNKNIDDIAARILEEAPPIVNTNDSTLNTVNQPEVNTPFNPQMATNTSQEQVSMPETSVHVGGGFKKFLNWKILTVGILGIILLTIGGVSAVKGDLYWIRDLVGMGIPSDPQKAIKKAESNTGKLEGYKTKMDMKLSGEMESTKVEFSTNLDISEKPKDKKAQVKLNSINVNIPKDLTGAMDMDEINKSVAGIEAISDNNTVYVKIPSVNDSWYQIDQSSVESIQELNNFVPAVFSKETEETQNPLTAAVVYAASSGEETTNIYNYLTNIKRVKDEKIDGKSSYHYQAKMDLAKVMGDTGGAGASYDEFVNKYLKTNVDIWVTKKEMVFSKVSLSMNFDMNMADFGAGSGSIKFDMAIDMKMSDFNKEVKIDVPKDAKKFDEKVFEDILGGNPVDTAESRNTKRKSDMKIIESALESYYADNNSYLVTTTDSKNGDFLKELVDNNYLASAIQDPSHPTYYYSYTSADGKGYTMTYVEETDSGITVQKITK